MKRADFVRAYANNSGLSAKLADWGMVDAGKGWVLIALPCACDDRDCPGWAMLSAEHILHHLQFDAPEALREAYMKSIEQEESKLR
jgi:hypothetical protein